MFDFLLGNPNSMQYWFWATNHPYLFTLIKIAQPSLVAIIALSGMKMVFGKRR